jgi:hypothetical protein
VAAPGGCDRGRRVLPRSPSRTHPRRLSPPRRWPTCDRAGGQRAGGGGPRCRGGARARQPGDRTGARRAGHADRGELAQPPIRAPRRPVARDARCRLPEGAAMVRRRTWRVVPVTAWATVSYSSARQPGIVYIDVASTPLVRLAEDLIHETIHARVHEIEALRPLVTAAALNLRRRRAEVLFAVAARVAGRCEASSTPPAHSPPERCSSSGCCVRRCAFRRPAGDGWPAGSRGATERRHVAARLAERPAAPVVDRGGDAASPRPRSASTERSDVPRRCAGTSWRGRPRDRPS